MAVSIDFTAAKKMIDNKTIRTSIEAVDYHNEKLEASFDQLENIYRLNVSNSIKKQALNFMAKQDKLIQIASDLKTRFKSLQPLRIAGAKKVDYDYDLDQLLTELDLLNEMHFRLKKTYFSFLNKYSSQKRQTLMMIA